MKKGLLLMMAGFMAFGVAVKSFASARLESMSTDARLVEDLDLIWLYPNKVLEYKNTVDFRLGPYMDLGGENTNEWGGILFEADPDLGVLGAYVNRAGDEYSANYGLWNYGAIRPFIRYYNNRVGNAPWYMNYTGFPNSTVDLFWAKGFGDADFGVHVNYSEALNSGEIWGLAAGLGLSDVGPFNSLSFHADYSKEWWAGAGETDQGIYTAKLGALASSDLGNNASLRTFLDLQMDGYHIDFYGVEYSDWGLDLGAAWTQKINGGKGLVSTGLIIDYLNGTSPASSYDLDMVTWNLFWNASVESMVNDWLTLRAGLSKLLVSRVYDRNDYYGNGTYYDNAGDNVAFNLGFSIDWQNVQLDCTVDVDSLENAINGIQPGNGIFFDNGSMFDILSADLKFKI